MEIYILRHGIAEDAKPGTPDSGRALTAPGRQKLRGVLERARGAGVAPSLILTSPYRRAVETAQVAVQVLGRAGLVETRALLPGSTPEEVWEEIRVHQRESAALLAGHNPRRARTWPTCSAPPRCKPISRKPRLCASIRKASAALPAAS